MDLEFEIRKGIGNANYSKKRQFRNTGRNPLEMSTGTDSTDSGNLLGPELMGTVQASSADRSSEKSERFHYKDNGIFGNCAVRLR